jgi:hypothetical protein
MRHLKDKGCHLLRIFYIVIVSMICVHTFTLKSSVFRLRKLNVGWMSVGQNPSIQPQNRIILAQGNVQAQY